MHTAQVNDYAFSSSEDARLRSRRASLYQLIRKSVSLIVRPWSDSLCDVVPFVHFIIAVFWMIKFMSPLMAVFRINVFARVFSFPIHSSDRLVSVLIRNVVLSQTSQVRTQWDQHTSGLFAASPPTKYRIVYPTQG